MQPYPMALSGTTKIPFGDQLIVKPTTSPESRDDNPSSLSKLLGSFRCTDLCVYNQPPPHSSNIPCGSQERYKEIVKLVKTPRSQNEPSLISQTENQHYGWLMSKDPDPSTQDRRFPRKYSEMTNFVKQMSKTNQEFSLF